MSEIAESVDYISKTVIEVRHISKSFDNRAILDEISMRVFHGEIVSVLGISGSGKTTLFNIIAGVMKADSGEIIKNSEIGYMLQKDLMMPWKTVEGNIELPLIVRGIKKEEATTKVKQYLELFGLADSVHLYPQALSGGMRQRAALLRTYLTSGEVLLLDEPFSSVDAITRHKLHKWLRSLFTEIGLTILLITHDIEEALLLSDRIYLLTGSPASINEEIVLTDKGKKNTNDNSVITSKTVAREKILEILEADMEI